MSHHEITTRSLALLAVALVCLGAAVLVIGLATPVWSAADAQNENGNVTEEEYVQPAPEKGDEQYEISSEEYYSEDEQDKYDPWVSYDNPRDEWRYPDEGDGSGKICVTLLNERGDVVAGESVPNTDVTIETGDELGWHTHADPFTVRFPITEHYDEMPYDADQFGTAEDLPQGDGYMDANCLEFHNLADDETIEYGPARVSGEYADGVEVVGYVQQEQRTWNSDVDPVEDAEPYESVGGGWTMEENSSHGQVTVVLQLVPEHVHEDYRYQQSTETPTETPTDTVTETETDIATDTPTRTATETQTERATETRTETATEAPGSQTTNQDQPTETATEAHTTEPSTADSETETATDAERTERPTENPRTETPTEDSDDDFEVIQTDGDGSNGAVPWLLAVAAIVGSAYGIVVRRRDAG